MLPGSEIPSPMVEGQESLPAAVEGLDARTLAPSSDPVALATAGPQPAVQQRPEVPPAAPPADADQGEARIIGGYRADCKLDFQHCLYYKVFAL